MVVLGPIDEEDRALESWESLDGVSGLEDSDLRRTLPEEHARP